MQSLEEKRDKARERQRRRHAENPERCKALQRQWQQNNKDKAAANYQRYYNKHRNKILVRKKAWRLANAEKWKAIVSKSVARPGGKDKRAAAKRLRCANDPNFRMRGYLATRIWKALANTKKTARTFDLLGCSAEDLWIYLESKFEEGMTRGNYGKVWHLDHIIPCALFDLTKPEHQKRCFHFSNLQPLLASENRRKGARQHDGQFRLL